MDLLVTLPILYLDLKHLSPTSTMNSFQSIIMHGRAYFSWTCCYLILSKLVNKLGKRAIWWVFRKGDEKIELISHA